MIKESAEMIVEIDKDADINYNERTLTVYSTEDKSLLEEWSDRLTYEILKENENIFEYKITECLWAKTFREADTSEIGDASICYWDYPAARKFNPKLKLV